MKIRIVYNFILFRYWKWIAGMTIYPFIFFRRGREEVSDRLFRHELEHIYQVREHGWFGFYLSYIWESICHGYKKNKYELAAELMENTPLTAEERKLKDS
jgi:hypothetical protein